MGNAASIFPLQNAPYLIPISFRDNSGNLISGWTGAASQIVIDGVSYGSGNAPIEASGGIGTLLLTASQMNGQLISVKSTITNSNSTALVTNIYTYPAWSISTGAPSTGGGNPNNTVRPLDFIGRINWIFQHFFGNHSFNRSTGIENIYDDSNNLLTTTQTIGSDVTYQHNQTTP